MRLTDIYGWHAGFLTFRERLYAGIQVAHARVQSEYGRLHDEMVSRGPMTTQQVADWMSERLLERVP